jgi:hypothetical protein
VLTHPTFVHLRSIKEGHRPNETLHYKAKQNEMNGTWISCGLVSSGVVAGYKEIEDFYKESKIL